MNTAYRTGLADQARTALNIACAVWCRPVSTSTSPSAVWNAITLAKPGTTATPFATGAATPIGAPSANSPRIVALPRHIRSAYSVSVSTRHYGKPGEDRIGTSEAPAERRGSYCDRQMPERTRRLLAVVE